MKKLKSLFQSNPTIIIKEFHKEYQFLSNFYLFAFEWNGRFYVSAEHAYQSQKLIDRTDKYYEVWQADCTNWLTSPADIKKASRLLNLRPDWEQVKLGVMKSVLQAKFSNPELIAKLLATGEKELQEGNTWNDVFWGVDLRSGYGENHLGKLLMEVRAELKQAI